MKPLHSLTLLLIRHSHLIFKPFIYNNSHTSSVRNAMYQMLVKWFGLPLPSPIIMQLHVDKFFFKKIAAIYICMFQPSQMLNAFTLKLCLSH